VSVDASLFGDSDFIAVRAALIAEVGAVEAIVLTRIHFRASESYRHAYERDGQWWWRAPVPTISEETGLSEKQVRRALDVLAAAGHIIAEQHQIEGRYDRAKSVRVSLTGGQMHLPQRADEHLPQGADVPSMKKVEDTPPTPSADDEHFIVSDWFEEAWKAWPRKDGKAAAKKAWLKASRLHERAVRHGEVPGAQANTASWGMQALLRDTVKRFAAAYQRTTAPKFIPHLSSWLNQERWTDPLPVDQTRGAYKPEPQQPATPKIPFGHRPVWKDGYIVGSEPIE